MARGSRSKSDVLDHLRHAVLTQALLPGADLDEVSLSKDWGLSRTPLREVLRQLSGEGYVEIRENRGARVAELGHTTLRDFFLTAPMIYGAVMRLAARNATSAQVSALKQSQLRFRNALSKSDVAERALANNAFHEITGEMADNTYLLPSFRRLLIDHARISMRFFHPKDQAERKTQREACRQHDAIISAIEAGDETAAAQLAEEHWNLSRSNIEKFVMPRALDVPLGRSLAKA